MAGLDKMYDKCGFIQQYIAQQIRELLDDPMNEYQDPNWVQAALLFERVVIPCEEYRDNRLYDLANDIIKKAEKNNNRVIYQCIPGMYNERILEAKSLNMDNLPDDTRTMVYDATIENIKKWLETQEHFNSEFKNFMKNKR